jgi:hypothetical protein
MSKPPLKDLSPSTVPPHVTTFYIAEGSARLGLGARSCAVRAVASKCFLLTVRFTAVTPEAVALSICCCVRGPRGAPGEAYRTDVLAQRTSKAGLGRLYGRGGKVPPSARIFMFWSAWVNIAVLRAISSLRAASSANIELSYINVYTSFEVVAVRGRASRVP